MILGGRWSEAVVAVVVVVDGCMRMGEDGHAGGYVVALMGDDGVAMTGDDGVAAMTGDGVRMLIRTGAYAYGSVDWGGSWTTWS